MSKNHLFNAYQGRSTSAGKIGKVFLALLAAILLAALGFVFYIYGIQRTPTPRFQEGGMAVRLTEGGTMSLSWSAAASATAYRVYQYDGSAWNMLGETAEPQFSVENVPKQQPIDIEIRSVFQKANLWGGTKETESRHTLAATIVPQILSAPEIGIHISGDNMLDLTWDAAAGETYEVVSLLETGDAVLLQTVSTGAARLLMGEEIPLPEPEQPVRLSVRAVRSEEGYTLYGEFAPTALVEESMLLGTELSLSAVETENHTCLLQWNAVRGDYYEIQQWLAESGTWAILKQVQPGEPLEYETERMASGSYYTYRVLSYYHTIPKEPVSLDNPTYAALPGVATIRARFCGQYCTVWPITNLTLRAGEGGKSLGKIPAGTPLCVLAEGDGQFYVRYQNQYGYINSDFCMINLPEYIGNTCLYDITNSYSSRFQIHEYPIEGITGQALEGYEMVQIGEDEFLVPFLYPCVGKLTAAADAARADGYLIKIYEAFRPNSTSRFLYSTTNHILKQTVPADDTEGTSRRITYKYAMTNNQFRLSHFLATPIAAHNRGIGLDVTLASLETGEELAMQTGIHDISWHSAISQNNENANLLKSYMEGAGMTCLSSKWWFFQDQDTRKRIRLDAYLSEGVSVEGWKKDDTGWRYRAADGSYYRDGEFTIDGAAYRFDPLGYVME